MDQRHQEYAAYYRARAARYQRNPNFPETARAEAAMVESIEGAATLEDWGADMQQRNLNVACAVALSRDQARADAALYDEISEPVRAAGPKRILAELTSADGLTATDVASRVSAILDQNRKEIAVDELTTVFAGDLDILEEIEIYETAEVPAEWQPRWAALAAEDKARAQALWADTILPNNRIWDPNWEFDEAKVWETRFRRRIPLPDAIVQRRLEGYRRYLGKV